HAGYVEAVVVYPETARHVRMDHAALPVVDDVSVSVERTHRTGERPARDIRPFGPELAADREARREIPLDVSGKLRPALEIRFARDRGAERSADGGHAAVRNRAPLRGSRRDSDRNDDRKGDDSTGHAHG